MPVRPKLWAYVVNTYEKEVGDAYPIVQHVFLGKTKEEALGYFNAHLGTDEFLRGCVEQRRWHQVECWTETSWQRV